MKQIFLCLIRFYKKVISPLLPSACRFYPTCSDYAYQSITECGAIRGSYYALLRILRCNPLFKGGIDPAPTCKHINHG